MAQNTKRKAAPRKNAGSKSKTTRSIKNKKAAINWRIVGPLLVVAIVGAFGIWKLVDTNAAKSEDNLRFRVASFNIRHTGSDPDHVWKARLRKSVAVIKNNHLDIVGLQEARDEQQKLISNRDYAGDEYDIWPQSSTKNPDSAVLYNRSKFTLLDAKQVDIKYNGPRAANVLHLKTKGANPVDFYFINTHDPVNWNATTVGNCPLKTSSGRVVKTGKHLSPEGHCGPESRKANAELYLKLADVDYAGKPIIVVGDFNSSYRAGGPNTTLDGRRGLAYCILTSTGTLMETADAIKGREGKCPSKSGYRNSQRPDHIFVSTSINVINYGVSPSGPNKNGSDVHDTIFNTIRLPRE